MSQSRKPLPRAVDAVIVGAGTCGVAVASRLIEQTERTVLLIEAGPDFGPFAGDGWPAELLDPTLMPVDHFEWGYVSDAVHGRPGLPIERARMIGGCSSHNGCAAVWGHRRDYDDWEAAGNPGWGAEAILSLLRESDTRLRVHAPAADEISPFHLACLEAAPAAGFPILPDLNDLDADFGIAMHAINIHERQRWNAAFAYLDPLRDHPRLQIAADTLVDRLVFDGPRCTGLDVIGPEGSARIEASEVILAGGAFGSPLVLLRSGVGPAAELAPLGIDSVLDLPGVGKNLQDHPAYPVTFTGTPELRSLMDGYVAAGGLPREEGTTTLARSRGCTGPFDLHLYSIGSRPVRERDWQFLIATAVMDPRSRGDVRLGGVDPEARPIIDVGYFTDPDDRDLDALIDGIDLIRNFAKQSPLTGLIGEETQPGPAVQTREELRALVRRTSTHDYHPSSTCKMGPDSDPLAVVDVHGRVHGLEGVIVADLSIAPAVPRANTNIPALVTGLRIADKLIADSAGSATDEPA